MRSHGAGGAALREALGRLEVDRLVLAIHDRSFPSAADEDCGVGSPYADAGREFLRFVRQLGFTGVQLGPQGDTSEGNPSPYDGTIFSRSRLTVALRSLVTAGLLAKPTLERLVATTPAGPRERIQYRHAYRAHREALQEAFATFAARDAGATPQFRKFMRHHRWWLAHDALYEVLSMLHGGAPWSAWNEDAVRLSESSSGARDARRRIARAHAAVVAQYEFEQFVAHEQHRELRVLGRELDLELWGDLQVGLSDRDTWAHRRLFLRGYALGAPPSRTNPEGQAWGYPVLDPGRPQASERFVAARVGKMLEEFDGVRIDHPHGYVCPWVYDATGDAARAVKVGARLHAAPNLPDHPALARFAIPTPAQLNPDPRTARWADDWVVSLTAAQLDRYDRLMRVLAATARRGRDGAPSLACEVLSTCPFPLDQILARHGLGRFRITQKADLRDPADVYRSENAEPPDWIMVGTHDTKPLWVLLEEWQRDGTLPERAAYLAWRLAPAPERREAFARTLVDSPPLLAQACFADLLASRARNVSVFFADAFGFRTIYNRPGVVAEDNWILRLPTDYRECYRSSLREDRALNVPLVLSIALRARGAADDDLIRRLDAEAAALRGAPHPLQ